MQLSSCVQHEPWGAPQVKPGDTDAELSGVVVPRLQRNEVITADAVNQPVLLGDPAGPCPRNPILQRFRLTYPSRRSSQRIIDQPIYPLHNGAVRLLPILVVFPRLWGEHQPQSRSSS